MDADHGRAPDGDGRRTAAPTAPSAPDSRRNLLLAGLPDAELQRLLPELELVDLALHDQVLTRDEPIKDLHFPLDCVLSLMASAGGGDQVEVATIGYEGMSGLPVFLGVATGPNDAFCQVPGRALRLSAAGLRRFLASDGALHQSLHRYTQATMVLLAQNVACNRAHRTEERCARWLLQTRDRVGADQFPLTQEFLAQMLGVRRGTVSLTASVLQAAGTIRYTRGVITVLDADALHRAACACYDIVQEQFQRLTRAPAT
ncbi:CRP-like cAMP-binding protein [Geodermatophilus normandii]|uniref:CRP-like cAMP-binding protein n=1 Tax=Geodermatophilus normandii TaxID=1137989 RepID=A0A317QI31_9ACTN|nr:Crp/Fnr family transcriptional regulator [Geodermatophilus normandii]PWW22729.1 CRP-like cAMP-binding protein [Geodermatophilus normandii]